MRHSKLMFGVGGIKQSGLGKEHGSEAIDYYMETKAIVVGTAPGTE